MLTDRRICFLRLRLDLEPFCSQPPDRDPMDQIRAYRFSLAIFLKRPPSLSKSTRSPILFKNNYAEVQFLAFRPLSFVDFEPAVQACPFCTLDPRVVVYLRLDPRFLQKTPCNLVFIADKPLDLVLALVYAF